MARLDLTSSISRFGSISMTWGRESEGSSGLDPLN